MYRSILVPLDGSPRAEQIFPHVRNLAQNYGSLVILLSVVQAEQTVYPIIPVMDAQIDAFEAGAREFAEWVREAKGYLEGKAKEFTQAGIAARPVVEQGPVVETILTVAERENADLIAMASHGRTGLSRVFYGSVAAGILQRVDRPLLLIRSREEK